MEIPLTIIALAEGARLMIWLPIVTAGPPGAMVCELMMMFEERSREMVMLSKVAIGRGEVFRDETACAVLAVDSTATAVLGSTAVCVLDSGADPAGGLDDTGRLAEPTELPGLEDGVLSGSAGTLVLEGGAGSLEADVGVGVGATGDGVGVAETVTGAGVPAGVAVDDEAGMDVKATSPVPLVSVEGGSKKALMPSIQVENFGSRLYTCVGTETHGEHGL